MNIATCHLTNRAIIIILSINIISWNCPKLLTIISKVGAKISTYGNIRFQAITINFSCLKVGGQIGKVRSIEEDTRTV